MAPDFHRRSLFAGGLGVTLAGLGLSACSSTSSTATAGTSTAAGSAPKVKVADVPVGGGMIMMDASYVVTQPTAGTFKAFSKVCTHQGSIVSSISDGHITCTKHGSSFSVIDGSVVTGPATKALPETKVTLSGDSLVIG